MRRSDRTEALILGFLGLLATSCLGGCRPGVAGATGSPELGVFVECDASGFKVRSKGKKHWYVIADAVCTINSAQIQGIGPHGELPEMVIHGSGVTQATSLSVTLPPGGEARRKVDLSGIDPCMDYTYAPPGQHERGPTSLVSEGPADAVFMSIRVIEPTATQGGRTLRLACKW